MLIPRMAMPYEEVESDMLAESDVCFSPPAAATIAAELNELNDHRGA